MVAYTITDTAVNLVIGGDSFTVQRNSVNGQKLIQAIREGKSERELKELADPTTYITAIGGGRLAVKGDVVTFNGEDMPKALVTRLLDLLANNLPVSHLVNFYEKVSRNPSRRAIQELYTFLEHKHIPLTPEGNFLAYKAVRGDYLDKHSGTYLNRPGCVLAMPRNKVCDDADIGCSYGFHCGSLEYASQFASDYGTEGEDRLVIVSVSPEDVVSIPRDCECQKLRTCKYTVLQEYAGALPEGGVKDESNPYADTACDCDDEDECEDDSVVMTQEEFDAAIEEAKNKARQEIRDEVDAAFGRV
jgi:hypothetical protein